ncbi:MAG: hydrogenase maturation protease [Pseudomonadota bacterium]
MKTLLLGMGNPILSDDAVGVRLARYLKEQLGNLPDFTVMEECSVGGLNILDIVEGYDRLIVLDSIKGAGGKPGDWYRFGGTDLRETMNLRNVHDTNFATALELGRRMGQKIPREEEISIFAVEVEDNLTFSERMTEALEQRFPEYAREIGAEVEKIARPPCFVRAESV